MRCSATLAIVATAFGVRLEEFLETGISGIVSLLAGVLVSFLIGADRRLRVWLSRRRQHDHDRWRAATYIVGPVTGTAIGASSEVVALERRGGVGQVDAGDDDDARSSRSGSDSTTRDRR